MVNCPKCGSDNTKPTKEWNYSVFRVKSFNCQKCETKFRDYTRKGKNTFTLVCNKKGFYTKTKEARKILSHDS